MFQCLITIEDNFSNTMIKGCGMAGFISKFEIFNFVSLGRSIGRIS